jgi:hypothetical protein
MRIQGCKLDFDVQAQTSLGLLAPWTDAGLIISHSACWMDEVQEFSRADGCRLHKKKVAERKPRNLSKGLKGRPTSLGRA